MTSSHSCNSVTHNLTIEQKEYAAKVLNESDENRENAVAEIKRWIQESDLRARTDDISILKFLRACKFNLEKTKIKLQNFQKLRANLPQWYKNRDPMQPRIQELLESGITIPLRKLDDQGRMVILARLVHNPLKFSFEDALQISTMVLDVAIRDNVSSSLYGCVIIIDMGYVTFRHLTQVRPRHLMNMTHSWQGCYPLRIKSINCINVLEIATPALMLGKYFLNNKLKQRVHFYTHKTTPDCFANIPDDILPVEYGGTDGTIQELIDYWKKVIEENRDWFIDDDRYKPVL